MKNRFVFLIAILFLQNGYLFASVNNYYRIKIGAYIIDDNANKAKQLSIYPSNIVELNNYLALVLDKRYLTYSLAKSDLKKVQKIYKDAYIINDTSETYSLLEQNEPIVEKKSSNFIKGLNFFNQKLYEKALSAFDRELIENDDNIEAKIYYAKSLFMLKLYDEATKEFNELLKLELDQKRKSEVTSYLKEIERSRKKHFFTTYLSVGIGMDDNINFSSSKSYTQYGPYRLTNDISKERSNYTIVSLILSHKYEGRYFDIYSTASSYNELFHTVKGNDLNYLAFNTAASKSRGSFAYLLGFGYDLAYLDGDKISYNFSISPSLNYKINKNYLFLSQLNYVDNHTLYAKYRDYELISGGLGLNYHDKNKYLKIGFSMEDYNRKSEKRYDISKKVLKYMIDSRYGIYSNVYIGANFLFENHLYKDLDDILGYKREDIKQLYTLLITRLFNKRSAIDIKLQHIYNDSNINSFIYKKNIYTFEYKYKF